MSIYQENMGIFQFFQHARRILFNFFYMFKSGEYAAKPFGIKFEVSSLCNLKCIMCPLSKGLKRKQGVLSFKKFKQVFDQINPSYLNLTGIGEPLLNKDLFKIIRYARKNSSIVKLDTNATLLNKDNSTNLLNSNPNIISVSIDGVDKKSYEKIRKNANFESVISNLKNLIDLRNSRKYKTKIHINFVMQKENLKDLVKFLEFADSFGVDAINGDIALPLGANKNIQNRNINKNLLISLKKELKNLKLKTSLNIEHVREFIDCEGDIFKQRKKNCFYPWYYPSITWDGNLVPCCYVCDNEVVFGNVFEEPFMKVWNNKKIRKFRKILATERKGICKDCFIDESYLYKRISLLSKIPLIRKISKRNWN